MTTQSEDDAEHWPFPDVRVAGVREHYQRVKFFHSLGTACLDPAGKFRLLLAGIYSARAMAELIFEAADKGQLIGTRQDLKTRLAKQIPWYDLIERIRIHDFHRLGLVPPDPGLKVVMQRGPVKLRARKGTAIYQLPANNGPQKLTTGDSEIEEQRSLLSSDGQFFDDGTRQYVSLEQVLKDFLSVAVEVIKEFETSVGQIKSGQ